jgi:hypothetical protein
LRNRWKERRIGHDAVVAQPSWKEYSCHPSFHNDGNTASIVAAALEVTIKIPSSSTKLTP